MQNFFTTKIFSFSKYCLPLLLCSLSHKSKCHKDQSPMSSINLADLFSPRIWSSFTKYRNRTATSVFAVWLPQTDTATTYFCSITTTALNLKKCGISGVFPTFEKVDCTLLVSPLIFHLLYNRLEQKYKDTKSNKRFALFTWSSYVIFLDLLLLLRTYAHKQFSP